MTNIRDVAFRAGVSTTTVSRYLKGGHIKAAEAVRAAVAELDYIPAPAARSLRSGRHNVIGVVVPDITNPFFAAAVRGVESVCRSASYGLSLYHTDEDPALEQQVLTALRGRLDGVVLTAATGCADDLRSLLGRTPVVFLDRDLGWPGADCVVVDNEGGARQAAQYLLALGHRVLAQISGPLHTSPGRQRHEGFVSAVSDAGLKLPEERQIVADFREEGGYQAMMTLLGLREPPTAVFSANNLQTIGALKALRDLSVRVPEDLSIIGFDDLDLGALLRPALTVIGRPMLEQGAIAARLLLARLRGEGRLDGQHIVLATKLIERGSCAPPPPRP